jgi:hypothetical protein
MKRRFLLCLCAALAAPASACDFPDEGNMPLRRAVARVRYLPQIEAWSKARHDAGELVQYQLFLEPSIVLKGTCYWTLDVRGGAALWRSFYVTPDGKRLLPAAPRRQEQKQR